ncbi:hypothetical protein [Tumebacillus lipolyticus]|uniref:Uncharacterized protein n=1 Tax=Tumebacillus lipolyticus TaxID=1280370 RepID=A0ABW5A2G0_9BACL
MNKEKNNPLLEGYTKNGVLLDPGQCRVLPFVQKERGNTLVGGFRKQSRANSKEQLAKQVAIQELFDSSLQVSAGNQLLPQGGDSMDVDKILQKLNEIDAKHTKQLEDLDKKFTEKLNNIEERVKDMDKIVDDSHHKIGIINERTQHVSSLPKKDQVEDIIDKKISQSNNAAIKWYILTAIGLCGAIAGLIRLMK